MIATALPSGQPAELVNAGAEEVLRWHSLEQPRGEEERILCIAAAEAMEQHEAVGVLP